jgi:hypothetical protein
MRVPGTKFDYGRPQFFATLLLLAFAAQAVWVAAWLPWSGAEALHAHRGAARLAGQDPFARWWAWFAPPHQPFTDIAAVAMASYPAGDSATPVSPLLARLPFVIVGLALAGAIWYVSKRLYGLPGGYIALALFAGSGPAVVLSGSATAAIGGAFGAFGITFVGIAVSHNLYAPLRNWAFRAALLIISSVTASGFDSLSALALVPLLGFMLYLVPDRRRSAVLLWGAATAAAAFAPRLLVRIADLISGTTPIKFPPAHLPAWEIPSLLSLDWLLLVLLGLSVIVFFSWSRPRYFGVGAPMVAAVWFLVLSLNRHSDRAAMFIAFVFAILFIAGICADLLETRYRRPVLIAIVAFLVIHAATGVYTVFRLVSSS